MNNTNPQGPTLEEYFAQHPVFIELRNGVTEPLPTADARVNPENSANGDEDQVLMPRGGQARRCTATSKRSGQRCKAPANKGYDVCRTHGAGTHVRVRHGSRFDPRDAGNLGMTAGLFYYLERRRIRELGWMEEFDALMELRFPKKAPKPKFRWL